MRAAARTGSLPSRIVTLDGTELRTSGSAGKTNKKQQYDLYQTGISALLSDIKEKDLNWEEKKELSSPTQSS